jgi:hypothetical protein
VLLVLDTSGSMSDTLTAVTAEVSGFLDMLDGDTRVGVTTVDVESTAGALAGEAVSAGADRAAEELDQLLSELPVGGGNEEGLEAVAMLLCRVTDAAPEGCTDSYSALDPGDVGGDVGAFRSGARLEVVFMTDEGDGSRRLATQDDDPSVYTDLYEQFGVSLRFHGLIPGLTDEGLVCNGGGATSWGTTRYREFITGTGGVETAISDLVSDSECELADVSAFLSQVAGML